MTVEDRAGLRWWEGIASPGPAGYALAVLVSAPVLGAAYAASMLVEAVVDPGPGTSVGQAVGWGALVTVFGLSYALVIGPPGVLVVHLLCRRVRAQAVHVAAAGAVGFLAGQAAAPLLVGEVVWPYPLAVLIGLATATARGCVIPLVPGARLRRDQRQALGRRR